MSSKPGVITGSVVWLAVLAAIATSGCRERSTQEIRVISDRTPSHLDPLFETYTKATGVPVKAVYLEEGLVARLESRPDEADVVITKDADLIEIARQRGLLQPYASEKIDKAVPAEYRDEHGMYFTDSYRARVIYYSKERVKPGELSTYEDLADPRWKGRVCIRSGYHDYNINLFGQMVVKNGPEKTRAFLEGLAANLARTPTGNDRNQVRGIYEKVCDVAIANSYYMGIMLSNPEQRPWGESAGVFFPNQDGCGSYLLESGLALTKATSNVSGGRQLLEYLVQGDVQSYIAKLTFAYPVDPKLPMPDVNKKLGAGQAGIEDGAFKACPVALEDIAAQRETVIKMLDEIRFDHPR